MQKDPTEHVWSRKHKKLTSHLPLGPCYFLVSQFLLSLTWVFSASFAHSGGLYKCLYIPFYIHTRAHTETHMHMHAHAHTHARMHTVDATKRAIPLLAGGKGGRWLKSPAGGECAGNGMASREEFRCACHPGAGSVLLLPSSQVLWYLQFLSVLDPSFHMKHRFNAMLLFESPLQAVLILQRVKAGDQSRTCTESSASRNLTSSPGCLVHRISASFLKPSSEVTFCRQLSLPSPALVLVLFPWLSSHATLLLFFALTVTVCLFFKPTFYSQWWVWS